MSATFDQIFVAVHSVPRKRLDTFVSLAHRAYLENQLDENELDKLQTAAQVRRDVFAARQRVKNHKSIGHATSVPPHQRSRLRGKRRTWAGSGALPPHLRCIFTPGENAVAAVVRAEVRRHGSCTLTYAQIADSAGLLSTTVVKRFVRLAKEKGLIAVKERRIAGAKNKPNVITIVSVDWKRWNAVGGRQDSGGTSVSPLQNISINNQSSKVVERQTSQRDAGVDGSRGLGDGMRRPVVRHRYPRGRGNG